MMNKKDLICLLEKNDIDSYRIEIINKLVEEDLNPNIVKLIYNILSKDHDIIRSFIKLLKAKNHISDIGIEQIEKILYHHDVEKTDKTIKSLLNKKISVNNILTKSLNDIKFIRFDSIMNEQISKDLYNVKWSGIGNGEILLCMILKDAVFNTSKRGDILIKDIVIEVKSDNSKLLNQSDFGNGNDVSDYWIEQIKSHDMIKSVDLLKGHRNNIKWNMTKNNNYLCHYTELLLRKGVNVKDVAELICSGWDKLFINEKMKRQPIIKILKKYKGLSGEAFKKYGFEVFLHNMNYYLNQSKIDHIALTCSEGFYLLDKKFFKQDVEKLREFSKQHFIYSYPSLTKTAANSRVFSISLLEN